MQNRLRMGKIISTDPGKQKHSLKEKKVLI